MTVGWLCCCTSGGSSPPGWGGAPNPSCSEAHGSSFGKGRTLRFGEGGRERHVLRLAEFPQRRPQRQEGGCAHTSHHVTARGPVASARAHSADEPEAQGTPLHHQAPEAARLWPVCGDRGPSVLPRCDSVTAPSVPTIRSLAQQQGHTRQLVYTGPVPSLSPRTEDGSRELPQPEVSSAPVCTHPKCQRLGVSGRRGRVAAALPPPACG